jgi:hypothetical protein
MFEASVDGEAYDPDRWSQYFRPAGMAAKTGDPVAPAASTPAPAAAPAPAAPVAEEAPFEADPAPAAAPAAEATAPAEGGGAQDILAMIRARQGQ